MSTGTPSHKPGPAEQLVAYLDGELGETETEAIEERLRKDPRMRRLAEELDRTWGMLDALGSVEADEQFSQRTMETIVATDMVASQQSGFSVRKLLSGFLSGQALAWFGIGVAGTLFGLLLATFRGPSPETTQFLREIELLERYPQYSIIPNTESLQDLQLPAQNPATSEAAP